MERRRRFTSARLRITQGRSSSASTAACWSAAAAVSPPRPVPCLRRDIFQHTAAATPPSARASTRRFPTSGSRFPASLLHTGQNTITLNMRKGGYFANHAMYDYIRLELTGYVPPPPASIAAYAGNNCNLISWPVTPGATSYNIFRSTTSPAATMFQSPTASPARSAAAALTTRLSSTPMPSTARLITTLCNR